MLSDQIWNEIRNMKGQTLRTLDRRKPFDILSVTESVVVIHLHSTLKIRSISRAEIENAGRRLATIGCLTRTEIHKEYSQYNPAYVTAILAELPGVKYKLNPIELLVTKEV